MIDDKALDVVTASFSATPRSNELYAFISYEKKKIERGE